MTLTDRYVEAALRRLPEQQRPDIEKELRASIADAVDGHLDVGRSAAEAEVAALTALGDPARLAAGYADRPLQLIGSAVYLDYVRLLKTLLAVVVPAVAAGVGLVRALRGDRALDVAGGALGSAFTAGLHIVVWTTLLFAVIDRVPALRRARVWTPTVLPDAPSRRTRYAELILESLATVLFCSFILLSPALSDDGIFSPWLWDTGVVYLFVGLVGASLGFSFAKYYARWSVPLAVAGSLTLVATSVTLIWLAANHKVLNPAFGLSPGLDRWIDIGLVAVSVGTLLHVVFEGISLARRRL